MIRVENLCKSFSVHKKSPGLRGSLKSLIIREKIIKEAVKDVSFSVNEGEIVGLVGANGAGKTTLIKILAGIIYPTSGKADILGFKPWERSNEYRRQMSLVMGQKAQLWWDLPAADCFILLKEIYQIKQSDFDDRLNYLCSLLGVKDELNIQIRRLSLGERMKMELIATLLHRPRVVFLDEPTIGLDFTAQRTIRDFLLKYREEHKPAMILTSHYMEDIKRLCKRIMIIKNGGLVFDGPIEKVVKFYADSKILTVKFEKTKNFNYPLESDLEKYGKLLSYSNGEIKIEAPRNEVALVASSLLQNFPVLDINIEETEIENIIEKIFREKETQF